MMKNVHKIIIIIMIMDLSAVLYGKICVQTPLKDYKA